MADLNSEGGYRFIYPVAEGGLSDLLTMEHDTNRINRIKVSWDFYFTKHWSFEREDGEPLITINYIKALIDKKTSFLCGEDFTLTVPNALISKTMPILQKTWDDNGRQKLTYEIVQEGSVTGDCFVLVTVGPPSQETVRFDPLAKYRIIIQKLHSHECEPVFDEETPPDKYGRKMRLFTITRQLRRLKAGSLTEFETVKYVMQITPEKIYTRVGDGPIKEATNILGEISVVHIQNKASSRTLFGIDDITDLIPLNREYNEKSTDISDTINYNAQPITVIIGARAKALERGPRAIWSGLPVGAKVELLKLEGDLAASVSYLERMKKAMHEISGVPEGSLGQMQPITGTSGDTLHMTYAPLMDERNKKKATYEPGFERINYFILRYAEIFQKLKLPKGICEKCGGKIAITYIDDPEDVLERGPEEPRGGFKQLEVRKCYVMDPDTFDFLDPDKHPVPYVRQHSFGIEITEIPFEQAEEEYNKVNPSYWDMAPIEDDPAADPANTIPPMPIIDGETGLEVPQPPPVPPKPELPAGFELPPEPEDIELPEVVVRWEDVNDPKTGKPLEVTLQHARERFKAVPLNCDQHGFLSPYTNYVTFNDTLPKDKAAQANLFIVYDQLKIVSKAWMMSQIGVENIPQMAKDIQQETMMALQALAQATGQKPTSTKGNPALSAGGKTSTGGKPISPIKQPGVVKPPVQSSLRGVPDRLRARRPGSPGGATPSNAGVSTTSTSH